MLTVSSDPKLFVMVFDYVVVYIRSYVCADLLKYSRRQPPYAPLDPALH